MSFWNEFGTLITGFFPIWQTVFIPGWSQFQTFPNLMHLKFDLFPCMFGKLSLGCLHDARKKTCVYILEYVYLYIYIYLDLYTHATQHYTSWGCLPPTCIEKRYRHKCWLTKLPPPKALSMLWGFSCHIARVFVHCWHVCMAIMHAAQVILNGRLCAYITLDLEWCHGMRDAW